MFLFDAHWIHIGRYQQGKFRGSKGSQSYDLTVQKYGIVENSANKKGNYGKKSKNVA